jgi:DNA topoisomerase-1
MKLLIVESPAKAKTIKGYLDSSYDVIASIGHFRDLPRSGIGIEEDDNFLVKKWEVDKKKIDPIINCIKKSDEIFLALDPDREGEMIAWHIVEICKEKKLIDNKSFKRVEFSAVRKNDILNAIEKPREINQNLVNAAITRRFLDRFFGYKISPITKRRTRFASSAGRVQSPTLRILCEKEKEIDLFIPKEYWEIFIELADMQGNTIKCNLLSEGAKRFGKLSIENESSAKRLKDSLLDQDFSLENVSKREKKRNPYSPFSNSLLLQDASSKLGFSPKYTNSLAQQLKDGIGELGALITYHRSDSNKMKQNEIHDLRNMIKRDLGDNYVSPNEIIYKERSKFVQQGHEAVTPTQLNKKPFDVKNHLNQDQHKLYELIWKRTIASQMTQSKSLETTYYFKSNGFVLKSSGSIQVFDGFKKIYNYFEKTEDIQELPNLQSGDKLKIKNVEIKQNFTKPPNRFSEAGLIKKLEEIGIGRPSTYDTIFTKLQERSYIVIKNKSLIPTSSGKILSKFLDGFFLQFVDYKFTADLEGQLDLITESKLDWKETLQKFLQILNTKVSEIEGRSITEVINKVNELSPEIIKEKKCPKCKEGELSIKFSPSGPFIGCTNFNKESTGCKYSSAIGDDADNSELSGDGKKIGKDPESGKEIFLKIGKYGRYLEMDSEENKPKRVSIPKGMNNEEINLDKSLKLIQLPRVVGIFPETKEEIIASIGPYGPYLKHNKKFVSLKEDDVTEIGINRAIELIQKNIDEKKEIVIGLHPETKKDIIQKKGIKGRPDYLSCNKKNYSIPKDFSDKKITLEIALGIMAKKKVDKKSK